MMRDAQERQSQLGDADGEVKGEKFFVFNMVEPFNEKYWALVSLGIAALVIAIIMVLSIVF